MDDFQIIDLPHETGEIVELTLWFRDDWDFDEVDSVAIQGAIQIGNWRYTLTRPSIIAMIGADRLKDYEDKRAKALEAQGVAA